MPFFICGGQYLNSWASWFARDYYYLTLLPGAAYSRGCQHTRRGQAFDFTTCLAYPLPRAGLERVGGRYGLAALRASTVIFMPVFFAASAFCCKQHTMARVQR